jgi:geranylgeranyl pyrophosphate synthase
VAGVDLRDGTPTLPLILAARRDECVARALAGEDVPDALDRVATTGALDEAREFALRYAAEARAALDGRANPASLETLTHIVVDREG